MTGTLSRGCMREFLDSKLEKFSMNFSSPSVNFKMASTGDMGDQRRNENEESLDGKEKKIDSST